VFSADSLATRGRLATADSSNAGWQRDVAFSHYKIARILAQQDDVPSALNEFREAKAIIARLKEQSPTDAQLDHDLSVLDTEIAKLEQAQAVEPGVEEPEQAAR
jgi:hypothetical protein